MIAGRLFKKNRGNTKTFQLNMNKLLLNSKKYMKIRLEIREKLTKISKMHKNLKIKLDFGVMLMYIENTKTIK